jgi:UDP-glucose 4-epimerase
LRAFVTGCAGFIGSNLTDRLLGEGHEVIGYDNFSTGQEEFLEPARASSCFRLIRGDTLDLDGMRRAMMGAELVFHLAANADVRHGTEHPGFDLEQNTLATFNVLEAMRSNGIYRIAFASSGSVYGEPDVFPTREDAPFPTQTSLYGASKLACEGLIEAYSQGYGFQGTIFRFVSILGERYTHGHVFDFYRQLRRHPDHLDVLGDGRQSKSYLYVQDCIDAMLLCLQDAPGTANIFNLGSEDVCKVNDSVGWITDYLGLKPHLSYSGGERGWVGDSPFILLDCHKARSLGWSPRLSIKEGILRTLAWLDRNPWILEKRE